MIHEASDLAEALRLAEGLRLSGAADWFRGQTRNWPLESSFGRRDADGQEVAKKRFARFHQWVTTTPQLEALAGNLDAIMAVAQHYGIPTTFVDFTTEPAVAAFFAAHDPPPFATGDVGCIICFSTEELASVWQAVRTTRPDAPEPERLRIDIPELWRIQSQRGVFLFYPFGPSFERNVFDFDRICFPANVPDAEAARLIAVEDIYPSQKSELEMLMDQYFMLEQMAAFTEAIHQEAFHVVNVESFPAGFAAECFGPAGLPEHDSWSSSHLAEWLRLAPETWVPISRAPVIHLKWPEPGDPPTQRRLIARYLLDEIERIVDCRLGPLRWDVVGSNVDQYVEPISTAMTLLWDGLRRWPFTSADLAEGLATAAVFAQMVAVSTSARGNGEVAGDLAARCLGSDASIEVEIGMSDGSYTRGHASVSALMAAVRDDFASYLRDEWKSQLDSIRSVLQFANAPRRIFRFDLLTHVFACQIAPAQVVLRGTDSPRARLYNPAQATTIGLP